MADIRTDYRTFDTWAQLLDHIGAHAGDARYWLWYQAPLDYTPVPVTATVRRDGRVRVIPQWSNGADPFTADDKHLSRFRANA